MIHLKPSLNWALAWAQSFHIRILLVLVVALCLSQGLSLIFFEAERQSQFSTQQELNKFARIRSAVQLLQVTPPQLHKRILRTVSSEGIEFRILPKTPRVIDTKHMRPGAWIMRRIQSMFPEDQLQSVSIIPSSKRYRKNKHDDEDDRHGDWDHYHEEDRKKPLQIALGLNLPGYDQPVYLGIQLSFKRPLKDWTDASLNAIGITLIIGMIAVFLILRGITTPLKNLENHAERLGRGENPGDLMETGPREIQTTIRTFNRMNSRIHRFLADRTMMLSALSHDLKSPITALRIRNELIDDEDIQEKNTKTLLDMEKMVDAILAFSKSERNQGKAAPIDLNASLQAILDDVILSSPNSRLTLPEARVIIQGDSLSIKRALTNVIENAIRYGDAATIELSVDGQDQAIITVTDQGPGIPDNQLEQVFRPFFRLEESRNQDTGGQGLGLSITRSIILKMGGDIALHNVKPHGLQVRITLPLSE